MLSEGLIPNISIYDKPPEIDFWVSYIATEGDVTKYFELDRMPLIYVYSYVDMKIGARNGIKDNSGHKR